MRAEDARRKALSGLAEAKKNNTKADCRDKMEKIEGILSSPDFCRVPIKAYGKLFREYQAQADASCAALLGRVADAAASCVSADDFQSILDRLYKWTDAKTGDEYTIRDKNYWGEPIMPSAIKDEMENLISQTVQDILSYSKLSTYFNGNADEMTESLNRAYEAIKDAQIPNTQDAYKAYGEIKASLDKVRASVADGNSFNIDANINKLLAKVDDLIARYQSGELTRSRAAGDVTLGAYINPLTADLETVNPDALDELQAGIIMYNIRKQSDALIDNLSTNSIRLMYGQTAINVNDDSEVKELTKQITQYTTLLQDAMKRKSTAETKIYLDKAKELQARKDARVQKYIKERKSVDAKNKAMGELYNEIAGYLRKLEGMFTLQPNAYKSDLKMYKSYIAGVGKKINETKKIYEKKVSVRNLADIQTLCLDALQKGDKDALDIIKTAMELAIKDAEKVKPELDIEEPDKEEEKVQQLDDKEVNTEAEDFLRSMGMLPDQETETPQTEGSQTETGEKEPGTKEPETKEPELDEAQQEEIKRILREIDGN